MPVFAPPVMAAPVGLSGVTKGLADPAGGGGGAINRCLDVGQF